MKNRNNSAWVETPSNLKEGSAANVEFISYIIEKERRGFSFRWNGKQEEYTAPHSNKWFVVPAPHHWEF